MLGRSAESGKMELRMVGERLLKKWNEKYGDKIYEDPIRHISVLIMEHLDTEGPDTTEGTRTFIMGEGERVSWWVHDIDINLAFTIAYSCLCDVGAIGQDHSDEDVSMEDHIGAVLEWGHGSGEEFYEACLEKGFTEEKAHKLIEMLNKFVTQ
jgi:hypothetical protein